jgi:ankyrin repeat protein
MSSAAAAPAPLSLLRLLDGPLTDADKLAARQLIEGGAYLNDRDDHGTSPLMCAVRCGHYDLAMMLLQRDADVSVQNAFGMTALQLVLKAPLYSYWPSDRHSCGMRQRDGSACSAEPLDVFDELLRRDSAAFDPNIVFSDAHSHLWSSSKIYFLPSALRLCPYLLHARGVLDFDDETRRHKGTLLHFIVAYMAFKIYSIRSATRDVYSDVYKDTAKIESGLSVVRTLLSLGLEVDCPTELVGGEGRGLTALALAVKFRHSSAVSLLLDARADPNLCVSLYLSRSVPYRLRHVKMLMHAAHNHSVADVSALLKASTDVNAVSDGHTALTLLLQTQSPNMSPTLRLLIAARADCSAVAADGERPLAVAISRQSDEIRRIEHDAAHITTARSNTPDEWRCKFMNTAAMILLCNGAPVAQTDIELAIDFACPNLARCLLHRGGSAAETVAYVNKKVKVRTPVLSMMLHAPAALVSHCKIPHSASIPRLPHLVPLHPSPPPIRVRALCVGGVLQHLLKALARPMQNRLRVRRSQLPRDLLPVLRCVAPFPHCIFVTLYPGTAQASLQSTQSSA